MCGIAGFVSKKRKPFDYASFCTLGIANDSRGGDSCGIFIDGLNQYGTGTNKLFSMFFQFNKSLKSIKSASIAFVHCRKASVGAINEKTAQPVVIRNKEGKVTFVLMHNGTIHNYKELAKKYIPNVDIKDMTDSQVMARIFYNTGYGVLNEYNGAAVFAIVDYRYREPRILFWKGASKKNVASKSQEEERPLYFCYDNDQIIFSSIAIHLMAIRKNSVTRSFPENILCEYKNNRLYIVAKYDRNNMIQTKQFNNVTTYYNGGYYNNRSFDDDYYNEYYWNRNKRNKNKVDTQPAFQTFQTLGHIDYSVIDNLYRISSKLAHGQYKVTVCGSIVPLTSNAINALNLWFFHGRLLYSNKCFKILEWLKRKSRLTDDEFNDAFENIIGFLSVQHLYVTNGTYMEAISPSGSKPFTGFVYPPICSTVTNIQLGIRYNSSFNGNDNHKRVLTNIPNFNFGTIKKQSLEILEDLTI